jgi:hypothetical protein
MNRGKVLRVEPVGCQWPSMTTGLSLAVRNAASERPSICRETGRRVNAHELQSKYHEAG